MEPIHVKLAEAKANWDAEKEKNWRDLATATKIVVKGIDIPFWDLVSLLVKIAFATIPAGIIVAVLWVMIASFFSKFL